MRGGSGWFRDGGTPLPRAALLDRSRRDDQLTPLTGATMLYMRSQPIRIGSETVDALRERSAQSGEPIVRLAQRYIDEGMRLERHPGIAFRDGPAGRRPTLLGGPDVWEVISAARSAPERGDQLIAALAERLGTTPEKIRVATRFYAEHPDEVDHWITMVEKEATLLEATLERERLLAE
ncbi:MAG: hypothetical protein NVS3B18_10160 [Candidatus Dormibacteria bacterium]